MGHGSRSSPSLLTVPFDSGKLCPLSASRTHFSCPFRSCLYAVEILCCNNRVLADATLRTRTTDPQDAPTNRQPAGLLHHCLITSRNTNSSSSRFQGPHLEANTQLIHILPAGLLHHGLDQLQEHEQQLARQSPQFPFVVNWREDEATQSCWHIMKKEMDKELTRTTKKVVSMHRPTLRPWPRVSACKRQQMARTHVADHHQPAPPCLSLLRPPASPVPSDRCW